MKSILIVDHQKNLCDLISEEVQGMGAKAQVAYNAKEALEKAKAKKFDLVITDIRLPDMDGIALLEKISKARSGQVGFMVLSDHTDYTSAELKQRGADLYLKSEDIFRLFRDVHDFVKGVQD